MFDSLIGGKFCNKCKHAVKCVRTRVEPIRRKKQAMVRFLKKDVADLLANGLDNNAFGRIDALIVEINHTSCYDMIEQYCDFIWKQLPSLQKQRKCPEDAMEAVSTLIYAAARYSDLPELSDLRRAFTERYGSQSESSVNVEFIDKLQKKSFSVDKKLQLMHKIAEEFSVKWDSKSFKFRMSNPPGSVPDQPNKSAPVNDGVDEASRKMHNGVTEAFTTNIRNQEISSTYGTVPRRIIGQKQVQPEPKDIHIISSIKNSRSSDSTEKNRKVSAYEPENMEPHYHRQAPYVKPKGIRHEMWKDDHLNEGITRLPSPMAQTVESRESVDDQNIYRAPPYTKQKGSKKEENAEEHQNAVAYERSSRGEKDVNSTSQDRKPGGAANYDNDRAVNLAPPYIKPKVNHLPAREDDPRLGDPLNGLNGEAKVYTKDNLFDDEKPRPRSVRRKHPKPPLFDPLFDEINGAAEDDTLASITPSVRRHCSRHSRVTCDDVDNEREEKMMERQPKAQVVNEIYGGVDSEKPMSRTASGRRRPGIRRGMSTYDDDNYQGADKMSYQQPKAAVFNEVDDGIDNLGIRTPSSRGRDGSRRSVAAYNDGDYVRSGKVNREEQARVLDEDNAIDLMLRVPSGRRRHGSARRSSVKHGGGDDEEKAMDRLLLHYSKKGMPENARARTREPPNDCVINEAEVGERRSTIDHYRGSAVKPVHLHGRAASLPPEPISPGNGVKAPPRAISMQPGLLSPNSGRVHPRLPDFDELAARVAVLRKSQEKGG